MKIVNGKPFASEQQILNSIIDFLSFQNVPFAHVRNTGSIARKGENVFFAKPRNCQKGVSDIIACYRGYPVAIEVKTEKAKLSEDQSAWLSKWGKNGGDVIVARSLDDVVEYFKRPSKYVTRT